MSESFIDKWVWRKGLTRAHWVESEIEDDIITKCGRRISPIPTPFTLNTGRIWCKVCDPFSHPFLEK